MPPTDVFVDHKASVSSQIDYSPMSLACWYWAWNHGRSLQNIMSEKILHPCPDRVLTESRCVRDVSVRRLGQRLGRTFLVFPNGVRQLLSQMRIKGNRMK